MRLARRSCTEPPGPAELGIERVVEEAAAVEQTRELVHLPPFVGARQAVPSVAGIQRLRGEDVEYRQLDADADKVAGWYLLVLLQKLPLSSFLERFRLRYHLRRRLQPESKAKKALVGLMCTSLR